ncbi:recombinase family protein [Bacillus sp. FJAT-49736]|nr:recombinase family protein [Bacillus sp. FJAT-49736]
MYELFRNEDFDSVNQFVEQINERGYRYRDNKDWTYGNVRNLLKSPIYRGRRKYKDDVEEIDVPVPHLRIVEEQHWEEVQNKLLMFTRGSSEEEEEEEMFFLLKGLIQCNECQQLLKSKKTKRKNKKIGIYQCEKHTKIKFDRELLEEMIVQKAYAFFDEILSPVFKQFLKETADKQAKNFEEIERKLERLTAELKAKIGNEYDSIINVKDASELSNEIKELLEELEYISERQERFKDKWFDSAETLKELNEFHEEFSDSIQIIQPDMRKDLIQDLLKDIIQGIYAHSESEITVIMKHPHIEGVGGREVIELK